MAKIVNTRKNKAKDNEQSYSLSTNYYALKNNDLKLLTPEEELQLNNVLEEIKTSEMTNIKLLEVGMLNLQKELKLLKVIV